MGKGARLKRILERYQIPHRCLKVKCPREYYNELCSEFDKILACDSYNYVFQWSFTELCANNYELLLEILKLTTTGISGPIQGANAQSPLRFKIMISMDNLKGDLYGYLLRINGVPTIVFIWHPLGPTMGHEVIHLFGFLMHSKKVCYGEKPSYNQLVQIVRTTGSDFYEKNFHKFLAIIFQDLDMGKYMPPVSITPEKKAIDIINEAEDKVKIYLESKIPEVIRKSDGFNDLWRFAYAQMVSGYDCDFMNKLFVRFINYGLLDKLEKFKNRACNSTKVIRYARYMMDMWNHGLPDELRNINFKVLKYDNEQIVHSEGTAIKEYFKNNPGKLEVRLLDDQILKCATRQIIESPLILFRTCHATKSFFESEFPENFEFRTEFKNTRDRYIRIFNEVMNIREDELIDIKY